VHVGNRSIRTARLAAGEPDDCGVAVGRVPPEIVLQDGGVGVDGELEQRGDPGGGFAGSPEGHANGAAVRRLQWDQLLHYIAPAVVLPEERSGKISDLPVRVRDLDGAEPAHRITERDGGVARAFSRLTPGGLRCPRLRYA
jgi:hypothetical protein